MFLRFFYIHTNTVLAAMRYFFFFPLFVLFSCVSSKSCTLFDVLLNGKIPKSNFCVKLGVTNSFSGPSPQKSLQYGLQVNFLNRFYVIDLIVFDISRYLKETIFLMWSGASPLGTTQMDPPKNNYLNGLSLKAFLTSVDI